MNGCSPSLQKMGNVRPNTIPEVAVDETDTRDPLVWAGILADEISAVADEIEETRRIPAALFARLHEARLCRMLLPRSFDGDEIHPGHYMRVIETIARRDASVAWNLFVANSAALLAAHLEPVTAQTIFGPADALVAWGPPSAIVAKAEPGGYRVSGRWDFASGCRNATWMGAHCWVRDTEGELRKNQYGQSAVLSLLFPVAQATLLDARRIQTAAQSSVGTESTNDLGQGIATAVATCARLLDFPAGFDASDNLTESCLELIGSVARVQRLLVPRIPNREFGALLAVAFRAHAALTKTGSCVAESALKVLMGFMGSLISLSPQAF